MAQTALPPVDDLLMTPQLRSLAAHVPDAQCLSPMKSRLHNDPYTRLHLFQSASLFEMEASLNEKGFDAVLFGCHLIHELRQQQNNLILRRTSFPVPASRFEQG